MLNSLILLLAFCSCVSSFLSSQYSNKIAVDSIHSIHSIHALCASSKPRNGNRSGKSRTAGAAGVGRQSNIGGSMIRQSRFARNLRDELSDIICSIDIKAAVYPDEDLLRATTIVDVEVSGDLSTAKVSLSVLGNSVEKRQVYVWLCDNVGQVRYSLANRLKFMKRVPELTFKLMDPQSLELLAVMDDSSFLQRSTVDSEDEEFDIEEDD